MSDETHDTLVQQESAQEDIASEGTRGQFNLEALRLRLDQFEGPFEVLLYLIKEQEIDIFDIPIVQVTQQYLEFLSLLRTENLDVAGDFLVFSATLIQIKSRMVLPIEIEQEEDEELEEEDPRLELVEKLLEYRKFRDLAQVLGAREERCGNVFGRRVKPVYEAGDDDDEEEVLEVSLYDLMKSIRGMMRFLLGDTSHNVILEGASVDEKIAQIETLLEGRESLSWTDLCLMSTNRVELVCCLLAILELCRMQRIRVRQQSSYGEVRLFPHKPNPAAAQEVNHEVDLALS